MNILAILIGYNTYTVLIHIIDTLVVQLGDSRLMLYILAHNMDADTMKSICKDCNINMSRVYCVYTYFFTHFSRIKNNRLWTPFGATPKWLP